MKDFLVEPLHTLVKEYVFSDTCYKTVNQTIQDPHNKCRDLVMVLCSGKRDWAQLQIQHGKVGIHSQGTEWE